MAVTCCVQVRSQVILQDKYQHICAGFTGHVADITATLTQIVSTAATVADCNHCVLPISCSMHLHGH